MPRAASPPGVYCILNLVNGKRYVGSTVCLKKRWMIHRCLLRLGLHGNRHLQGAWSKYGESNFKFLVLAICGPQECVKEEQRFIDLHDSADHSKGYNITPTAGSPLGMKLTAEQKRKIGDAHRGKLVSDSTRKKIGDANRGRKHPRSLEYRAKLSKALRGKRKTKEHKLKLSLIAKLQPRAGGRFFKGDNP